MDKKFIQKNNTLMIWATSNIPGEMINTNFSAQLIYQCITEKHQDPSTKQEVFDQTLKHVLWVTSITPYNVVSDFSSRPGEKFQKHTISALGTDILVIDHNNSKIQSNGTSFAAPTVTGVAALLKEEYPEMTPYDIKTSLLESADKEIFPNYGELQGIKLPNGKIRLDPKEYGQGILNAPHALLYAKILRAKRQLLNNPNLETNSEEVKMAYQIAIMEEEKAALDSIKKIKWLKKREPMLQCKG